MRVKVLFVSGILLFSYAECSAKRPHSAKKQLKASKALNARKPFTSKEYVDRGIYYMDEVDDNDLAIRDYTKAIALDPKNIMAYCKRAEARLVNKEVYLAKQDIVQAEKINPRSAQVFFTKAALADKLGDMNLCMENLKNVLEIDPNHEETHLIRSMKYFFKMNDRLKGIEELESVIKTNPESINAYHVRGTFFVMERDNEKALQCYYKSADLAVAQKKKGKAQSALKRIKKLDPNSQRSRDLEKAIGNLPWLYGAIRKQ